MAEANGVFPVSIDSGPTLSLLLLRLTTTTTTTMMMIMMMTFGDGKSSALQLADAGTTKLHVTSFESPTPFQRATTAAGNNNNNKTTIYKAQ